MARPDFIPEDIKLQRSIWIFERVARIAFILIIAAAALGTFGGGPLAAGRATAAGGTLVVDYPRFGRVQKPLLLRVNVHSVPSQADTVRIWFTPDYLDALTISQVAPTPDEVVLSSDRVTYAFNWSGTGGTARIVFDIEARQAGSIEGELGLGDGGAAVRLRHFFFP